jgi:hypothetical protein
VSFFSGIGKATFSKHFYQNATFITGNNHAGCLFDTTTDTKKEGFLAFLRLIGTIYYKKYASGFEATSPAHLFNQTDPAKSEEERHYQWIETIRQGIWDRITYETDMIPSISALWRHWQRTCWVMGYWNQAAKNVMTMEDLHNNGWKYDGAELVVEWDSEENSRDVRERVDLLTKGCKCRTGCTTLRCSCRKSGGTCSVGCECINCKNLDKRNEKETNTTSLDDLAIEEEVSNEERDDIAEDMEDWIKEFTTESQPRELDGDI